MPSRAHSIPVAILVMFLGIVAVLFAGAPAAAAAGAKYVALGDSYSSGVGAGDYTDQSGDCDRSPNAYPALWAARNTPASFVSVACSGATTADVINDQLPALRRSTTLVSLTVGGNDEEFAHIMVDCNLYGDHTCVNEIQSAENDARANLPGRLASLYRKIRAGAPHARVVVLGYPRFYDLAHHCIGLSQTKRAKIDEGIGVLDSVIRRAAAKAGFWFADVRSAFGGHEICDAHRWLHSVDFFDLGESYHPTAHGQSRAYLPRFSEYAG